MQGPVFIVGVNGSGTTMLADTLGRHPDLYVLPTESRVLPYFAQRFSDADLASPQSRRTLADQLGASRAFRWSNGRVPPRLDDAESLPARFSAVVGAVYMVMANKAGKRRWGDKSPMYLQHMTMLAERFPDARFVHIYRDARDAAQSFHRRWRQNSARSVYRWKQAIRLGRAQGQQLGPGRYMEVSYEAITEDAETWMRRICEFAGLPFHPAVLESSMRMMDASSRESSQGRIVKNSGRWKRYYKPAELARLEGIAGSMLAEMGYEVTLKGDADPAAWQLLWWKMADRVNLVLHHLQTRGLGGAHWLVLRIRDALRQDAVNKY